MFVLMAIVTTASTAPIVWAIWLRHHNLPTAQENPFVASENYLSLTLDREYLDHLEGPAVDIEDMVTSASNGKLFNIANEQQQVTPGNVVDDHEKNGEFIVPAETSFELPRVPSTMGVSYV